MTYPYIESLEDLKKIITPDCKVVLDLDQTCYVAASGSEKLTIIAKHKGSGAEKSFKNKTEFWGAKKTAIGGWLHDENTNRQVRAEAAGKQFKPFAKEDFEIIEVQTPEPVENCLHTVKTKIISSLEHIGFENYIGVLGGDNNFRLALPAPEQYKSNREGTLRPVHLKATHEYVIAHHNASVIHNIEADDYLAILGYEGYIHYKNTGKFNYIVASFDKDQRGTPSLIFNTLRAKDDNKRGYWVHPIPMLIDDSMGEIWMEKGKVCGWGQKFLGYQMLMGDTTDTIKPYQNFGIKFGDLSAFKVISPCTTEKEMWIAIMNQYKTWFPPADGHKGVRFTSWDGREIDFTAGQWASVIYQMVYMKRSMDDRSSLAEKLRSVGAI